MLQLSPQAPLRQQAHPLKANNSQRVGNTEVELETLCKDILTSYQKFSESLASWMGDDDSEFSRPRLRRNGGHTETLRALIAELKTLNREGKYDERVVTLRQTLERLEGYASYDRTLSV